MLRALDKGVPKLTRSQLRLMKSEYLSHQLSILIDIKKCRAGFEFHTASKQRIEGRWLYVTEGHKNVTLNTGIIIHDNCPYDYCQTDVSSLIFNLETPVTSVLLIALECSVELVKLTSVKYLECQGVKNALEN